MEAVAQVAEQRARAAADRIRHVARSTKRGARPRMEQRILADQRSVEVARDGLDGAREVTWELQPCGLLRKSTSAFRSAGGSDAYDFGMTFFG